MPKVAVLRKSEVVRSIYFPSRLLALAAVILALTLGAARPSFCAYDSQSLNADSSSDKGFFSRWLDMVSKTQAEQPHWITPLATTTPRLEQEYRYDQLWQSRAKNVNFINYGAGKGLELIPTEHTEFILGTPAWQSRNHPGGRDGFADETFLVKYRLLAANEQNGNYILTLFLGVSVPSGSKFNTTGQTIYTPWVAFGKGWGDFDIQTTVGMSFPDGARDLLGTPIMVNTAFQYHFLEYFWPEVEVNYTYWPNGEHPGKNQVYITSGLVFGRIHLWQRVALTIGAGYQVALTHDALYHNQVELSVRLPF